MTGPQEWGPLLVDNVERRRELRRRSHTGLDTVEVMADLVEPVLRLGFLDRTPTDITERNVRIIAPPGGAQVRALSVVRRGESERDSAHLTVRLNRHGGAGVYRLRLVETDPDEQPGHRPKRGVDPRFAEIAFTFDTQRPVPSYSPRQYTEIHGADMANSYLARDYAGLRQLMLDRLTVTLPADTERNPADLTVMLVELFAYVADELSYAQDDAATEAYLSTARRRVSIRRHARLVDYHLHEGCHARGWVCLDVSAPVDVTPGSLRFVCAEDADQTPAVSGSSGGVFSALAGAPDASPASAPRRLHPAHVHIALWSFGEHDATLRAGARSVTLVDGEPARTSDEDNQPDARDIATHRVLELEVGDVLILEALTDKSGLGPPEEGMRHAVRITHVHRSLDLLYGQALLDVHWAAADALPFDLPISVSAPDGTARPTARACGNAVLVGHGGTVTEDIAASHPVLSRADPTYSARLPDDASVARHQAWRLRRLFDDLRAALVEWRDITAYGITLGDDEWHLLQQLYGRDLLRSIGLPRGSSVEDAWTQSGALNYLIEHADRFFAERMRRARQLARQCEAHGPLSVTLLAEITEVWGDDLARPLDPAHPSACGPATAAVQQDPRAAAPLVSLVPIPADEGEDVTAWTAVADLLDGGTGRRFVVEVDDHREASLRLDPRTDRPRSGRFAATYWTGNGRVGNVPAESINALLVDSDTPPALLAAVTGVRNPLPTTGGADPEDTAAARLAIPGSFRDHQPRGLSSDDYAHAAMALPGVARAAAETRFDGRRVLIDVCVEQAGSPDPTTGFLSEVRHGLSVVRRIGHDLRVSGPQYRPLRLGVTVWIDAVADEQSVERRVNRLLGCGWADSGAMALFHPSRLDFGQPVWASEITAAISELPGIEDVRLTTFAFLDDPRVPASLPASLRLSGLEIASLDNKPERPEHGIAHVTVLRSS